MVDNSQSVHPGTRHESYIVREAGDSDVQSILGLFADVSGVARRQRLADAWDWRWHHGPGDDDGRNGYRGAVALFKGKVVGTVTWFPARFLVGERAVNAYWQVDSLVHPDHRRKGLASRLITLGSDAAVMMAKGTSDAMLAARLRNGYRIWETSGEWSRNISFSQRCARFVGKPLARIASAIPAAIAPGIPEKPGSVDVYSGPFDEGFTSLWQDCRRADMGMGRRDAEVLNWRYRELPGSEYDVLVCRHCDGSLAGYVVIELFDRRRRLRGAIIDLLCPFDSERILDDLLAGAVNHLQAKGADSATCYAAHPRVIAALERCGFRRSQPQPMTVLGELPAAVHVTSGDGF